MAQQAVDHLAHAVISQTAVEGVDQVGGAVVADSVSGVDGGRSEREKQMAFAGPGWPDEADILRCSDPFEAAEVVEGGPRDWRGGQVELVQRFADREAGLPPAGASVRLVAGRDLGLDQGPEELLRVPPLRFRRDQQFGGEAAHPGHFQPFQPGGQVRRQSRRCGAHGCSPPIR